MITSQAMHYILDVQNIHVFIAIYLFESNPEYDDVSGDPEPGRVWRAGRGRDHRQWCAGARSVLAEVPTTASRDPRTRAATFAAKMWLHWSLVSRARRCVNRAVNEIS